MAAEYSENVCRELEDQFRRLDLLRPMRIACYDPGQEITCRVAAVDTRDEALLRLRIERFAGGGFAGQVYRVRVEHIDGTVPAAIVQGGAYAMKILKPPSAFALFFRNSIYAIGFQAPFQLQTNPSAARAGALWQKFFRRGARIRLGTEQAVNDIHVTFVDERLGACAELSDWIDGRTWKLEVDDHMDALRRWKRGIPVREDLLGSPEYRAKKQFMHRFVRLLHDMGGHEFARQYEWSTCKSQPNCLKRLDAGEDPAAGLTAVDFRAGLALLPFLPMSPGDFSLIAGGLTRGSLVQFDRGDTRALRRFIDEHPDEFTDMLPLYDELEACEKAYRDSQPDITRNRTRLLTDRQLWRSILDGAVTGWRITGTIDRRGENRLRGNRLLTLLFYACSLLPFAGRIVRKAFMHAAWRRHYAALFRPAYLSRAFRGIMLERIISWHRAGRVTKSRARRLARSPARVYAHLLLSLLPVALHRFFTDPAFARARLAYIFVRPVRLYFDAALREQWLRDMVDDGRAKHSLTPDDAQEILSQLQEPFIQKYLKSLAVHVCTLPVTQIVSVAVAVTYVVMNPGLSAEQAWIRALGIIAAFQVVPVSPGSLVRGLYVLYLVVRERNFRDYNIAVFLGFFKYIGYLAFPIQMAYRYPTLARFMAVHWATGAVPAVPVFGERGALLEHAVFCTFYNWPLTIRRRIRKRMRRLAGLPARHWHILPIALTAGMALHAVNLARAGTGIPASGISGTWWLLALAGAAAGASLCRWSGGMHLKSRIVNAALSGPAIGLLYTLFAALWPAGAGPTAGALAAQCAWSIFVLGIFTTIGALLNEFFQPDTDIG